MAQSNKNTQPVFNGKYQIMKSLGEGNTSKVYLGKEIGTENYAAIKILKEEFLRRDRDSVVSVQNEIQILKSLDHSGIIKLYEYGDQGQVVKSSGRVISDLVYIVMEYVEGGLLFDLCQNLGGMGEDAGRFFMHQMLDAVEQMHRQRIVHRDLKLENILIDDQLNLKVADFGFATHKNIDALRSYRGTMTYMAPEIKEGKTYRGEQIDMFSIGVITWIIVCGIFPFKEAKRDEYFYNLLNTNQTDKYFQKTNQRNLSADFKDLILKFFAYNGDQRPTIEQVRAHPWMQQQSFDSEVTRANLRMRVAQKQQSEEQTAPESPAMPNSARSGRMSTRPSTARTVLH